MTRPIPQVAVDFVAQREGLKLKAYQDSVGIWTIGFGHIDGVKPGDVITKATALAYLRTDMQIAVRKLYGVVKAAVIESLSDHQYAALLSFCYNVGAGKGWGIWKVLNAGKLDLVPGQLVRFDKAGGRTIKGLTNRRADEVKLWATIEAHETIKQAAPPSNVTRLPGMTPPAADVKPVAQSKTFWAGGIATATSVAAGAQQVQAIVAPQASNSTLLTNLLGLLAVLGVAAGVAVMVFRYLDAKHARQ